MRPSTTQAAPGRATASSASAGEEVDFVLAGSNNASMSMVPLSRASVPYYDCEAMEVHRSARKHGVADPDMLHAVNHPVASFDLGHDDSPRRRLVIGPDRAGNLLEVIVLVFDDDRKMVIHAMKLRPRYEAMLEGDI